MIGHWQKINLEEYFNNLKDYYNNCEKPSFRLSHKVQELTEEEKTYVNENINLKGITGVDKESLLNSILKQEDKFYFAKHLLISDNIEIEVNELLDNKSTFIYLLSSLIKK